jgi:hypothetical protein
MGNPDEVNSWAMTPRGVPGLSRLEDLEGPPGDTGGLPIVTSAEEFFRRPTPAPRPPRKEPTMPPCKTHGCTNDGRRIHGYCQPCWTEKTVGSKRRKAEEKKQCQEAARAGPATLTEAKEKIAARVEEKRAGGNGGTDAPPWNAESDPVRDFVEGVRHIMSATGVSDTARRLEERTAATPAMKAAVKKDLGLRPLTAEDMQGEYLASTRHRGTDVPSADAMGVDVDHSFEPTTRESEWIPKGELDRRLDAHARATAESLIVYDTQAPTYARALSRRWRCLAAAMAHKTGQCEEEACDAIRDALLVPAGEPPYPPSDEEKRGGPLLRQKFGAPDLRTAERMFLDVPPPMQEDYAPAPAPLNTDGMLHCDQRITAPHAGMVPFERFLRCAELHEFARLPGNVQESILVLLRNGETVLGAYPGETPP